MSLTLDFVMLARPHVLLTLATFAGVVSAQGTHKVVAWNDLGMHCMDSDYSVFSILPPFNTVQAQVIDATGHLVTSDQAVRVYYEAINDPSGSGNRTSIGKTNYWTYANVLYGGSNVPDTGLAGHDMPGPGNVAQPMAFDAGEALFHAEGIPATPFDDNGHKRTYPMMRVVAKTAAGAELGSAATVLPVSDEMDCSLCHASGSLPVTQPRNGWAYDPSRERDYRRNILRLHDDLQSNNTTYQQALATLGYSAAGLAATADGGRPILCASCHLSNALPGTGLPGISALTAAMHAGHANVVDPITNQRLDDSSNRASCYRCHPGSETRCLRGVMGNSVANDGSLAMQCQSCHGNMSRVGAAARTGWLDQPNCQNCHSGTATQNSGQIRYTTAFDGSGNYRTPANATFATNPDVPAPGFSLYRFSKGHGELRCEACHGSTHAEYPGGHSNDNIQSVALQGHEGTLAECSACHGNAVPLTGNGGPHGMHTIGQTWVIEHHDYVEGHEAECRACHGADSRGTVLSAAQGDRSFPTRYGTKVFPRGSQVGCYACHNGPNSENRNPNIAPVVQDASASTVDQTITIPLTATDADNNPLTLRVVKQAAFGRVVLNGTTATYYPDPGFAGEDRFTFLARDAAIDSNLGTVRIQRGAAFTVYGAGYPGTGGQIPTHTASGRPVLDTTITLDIQNTSGSNSAGVLVMSTERANLVTPFGGALMTEPAITVAVPMPASGLSLPLAVPNSPAMIGLQVCSQSIQADAGAHFGLAFSRGLSMVLGL
ncbi:MAG: Ig-like domain-containing protein [Planctomycetota bacterium]